MVCANRAVLGGALAALVQIAFVKHKNTMAAIQGVGRPPARHITAHIIIHIIVYIIIHIIIHIVIHIIILFEIQGVGDTRSRPPLTSLHSRPASLLSSRVPALTSLPSCPSIHIPPHVSLLARPSSRVPTLASPLSRPSPHVPRLTSLLWG